MSRFNLNDYIEKNKVRFYAKMQETQKITIEKTEKLSKIKKA
ncbi:hypothetical protein [Paenibacillus psychroresistens]|nr:hypothetical protein [Paenibacillus psychroresistens]